MRGRIVIIAVLVVAAIAISLWQPWRDAGPAPADVSPQAVAVGEPAGAPPPAAPSRQGAAPDAGAASAPVARLSGRRAARDAGASAPDAGDEENRARFRALHQAMVTATPEAARLYGAFVRSRVPAPPETMTLVAMKERGVPQDELVAFVKSNFHELPARAIALRWLGVGAGTGTGLVRPSPSDPTPATGSLVRRDGG
jgi:hypothetical protein